MSESPNGRSTVTVAAVLARAGAYIIRAARTKSAVERMKERYEDRAASARYLSEAMTRLDVDEPTTTAYMEVSTLGTAAAGNVGSIVSAADALAVSAQAWSRRRKPSTGACRTPTAPTTCRWPTGSSSSASRRQAHITKGGAKP
jgi:hypothetical protein